jgi:hypothetical protein
MIETALLSPVIEETDIAESVQVARRNACAAAVLAAIDATVDVGEDLRVQSAEEIAAHLTNHPELFGGVAYLPNAITPAMVIEARTTPVMAG